MVNTRFYELYEVQKILGQTLDNCLIINSTDGIK